MNRSKSWFAVLPSLVIPVCIGLMLYIGLLALIQHQWISDATVLRYLMGHPVSQITVGMFLIGAASLMLIGVNVFEQFRSERKIVVQSDGVVPGESAIADHAVACGQSMLGLPRWMHDHYLWQRLSGALQSIYRTQSTTHVEEELKYLADLDVERQQQRYSLVQILIWATPMLGFLGTVLGISQALGGITVGPENDFQQMMDGLRGSLNVAFDTTALALTLSMVLMFGQFLIDRFESQLLQVVDQRARSEIGRQFDLSSGGLLDSQQQREQELSEKMVAGMREAVEIQTEIWRTSIATAEQTWASSLTETNREIVGEVHGKIETDLSGAIDKSVSDLAHYLGETIQKADQSMSHRWEQWQVMLSDNARLMSLHQTQLCEQTELIQNLLVQTEDVALFEPAISKNNDAIEQTERLRATLDELSSVVGGLAQPPTTVEVSPGAFSAEAVDEAVDETADELANESIEASSPVAGGDRAVLLPFPTTVPSEVVFGPSVPRETSEVLLPVFAEKNRAA